MNPELHAKCDHQSQLKLPIDFRGVRRLFNAWLPVATPLFLALRIKKGSTLNSNSDLKPPLRRYFIMWSICGESLRVAAELVFQTHIHSFNPLKHLKISKFSEENHLHQRNGFPWKRFRKLGNRKLVLRLASRHALNAELQRIFQSVRRCEITLALSSCLRFLVQS